MLCVCICHVRNIKRQLPWKDNYPWKMTTLLTQRAHRCTLSSPSLIGPTWLTEKANLPTSAFLYSTNPLILSGRIGYPLRSSSHTQSPFFFSLTLSHSVNYFDIAYMSSWALGSHIASTGHCVQTFHRQDFAFSCPSHHHCCPKTKKRCQSPQGAFIALCLFIFFRSSWTFEDQ